MINLHTKFEVSICFEGNAKCSVEIRVVFLGRERGKASSKATGNVIIQWSAYDFLSDFNRNYASILYRFRVIAIYLSKVAYFNLPHHLHLVDWCPTGVTPFEFCRDLWHQKTGVPVLSCDVVCVILCLAVLS